MASVETPPKLRPHHEQKDLCTTRLPYRQGRKLTAVKVYTINNESKHLLIFGVPSLNLRQETKRMFMKYGKLLKFNLTNYPSEQFTETYHAIYESIQSARMAKRILDTKNYYGGHLHICYAPEMETVEDVREKLLLRRNQVNGRLRNLEKEAELSKQKIDNRIEERLSLNMMKRDDNESICNVEKMNMGAENTIAFSKRKFKDMQKILAKKAKVTSKDIEITNKIERKTSDSSHNITMSNNSEVSHMTNSSVVSKSAILYEKGGPSVTDKELNAIEVIDFTSPHTVVLSNINETLNYKNFGNEIIKKVPYKPVNRIKFNVNKKS